MSESLIIDGSYGEGGGSIIRLSMALAFLLNKRIKVVNIRKNRKNPGLRLQHCTGINLINKIRRGKLIGVDIGSSYFEFNPINVDDHFDIENYIEVKVETAASIGLIFQAVSIALIGIKKEFTIVIDGGATYGQWAPSITYFKELTLKYLEIFGYKNFEISVDKHGFYPKGGSRVTMAFKPIKSTELKHIILKKEDRSFKKIKGISIASNSLKRKSVAHRQTNAVSQQFKTFFPEKEIEIETVYVDAICPGSGITLWTDNKYSFGSSIVGRKGAPSEKVAKTIMKLFYNDWNRGGVIDNFMADQIIPFLTLNSPSKIITGYPISKHTLTNIWVVKKFFPVDFKIKQINENLTSIEAISLN